MKNAKKLPVTLAVLAALCSGSALAQETITQDQLDRIVAQAVEKALAERQAKLDAIASKRPTR
nr:putative porin [Pectobacterium sp. PL152]